MVKGVEHYGVMRPCSLSSLQVESLLSLKIAGRLTDQGQRCLYNASIDLVAMVRVQLYYLVLLAPDSVISILSLVGVRVRYNP